MYGYMGKDLRVNLSEKRYSVDALKEGVEKSLLVEEVLARGLYGMNYR